VPLQILRYTHLGFAICLAYLIYPATKNADRRKLPWYDIALSGLFFCVIAYFIINYKPLQFRAGAYTTLDIVPLFYTKNALEGKRYTKERVGYSYGEEGITLDLTYQKNNDPVRKNTVMVSECPYDMISMFLKARSFDGSKFKVGDRIKFMMAEGKHCEEQYIVYRGREKFTNDYTDVTYDCLVFSFVEKEKKKEKEVVTFYVTNDKNHIPVRLDLHLRFGSAKAFLKSAKGIRK
jgi:hypothetical protein